MTLIQLFAASLLIAGSVFADLKERSTTAEFRELVDASKVPVVVQFSAYWCGPCQDLRGTMTALAPNYADDNVQIAYVDAYVNSDLQQFLMGGYPTVRVFKDGSVTEKSFVGSQTDAFVRDFLDAVVAGGE